MTEEDIIDSEKDVEEELCEEDNIEMIYDKMSKKEYFIATTIIYLLVIVSAIFAHRGPVQIMFDVMSAFSSSCLICIFPGIFYLLSLKYNNLSGCDKATSYKRRAIIFVLIGLVLFSIQMLSVIYDLV